MIKKFNIVILVSALFFIALSSCNKESTLPILNENQNSTNDTKSLIFQVKNWHDSVVSNKVIGVNSENNIKSFSLGLDDITPPAINWELAYKNFDSANVESLTVPLKYNISTGEIIQLVATSKKDTINGYLVRQIPDSSYYANHPNILDLNGYTGKYIIYDLMGHCLKIINFRSGSVLSNSSSQSEIQSIRTNGEQYVPISPFRAYVYGSRHLRQLNDLQNFSGFAISLQNQFYNGVNFYNFNVIVGGGSIYNSSILDLIKIPNGFCVFGSLSFIGSKIGLEESSDFYLSQWAAKKGLSLDNMRKSIGENSNNWPSAADAIGLLKSNFDVTPINKEDIETTAKLSPIFTIISWGDGTGHAVVIVWDSDINSLYYYDPTGNVDKVYFNYNSEQYPKMKLFYRVNGISQNNE
ncbi:MAG: hypothetical protein D4R91_05660 [Sediminibacterium sp.]|nr:MAG: hypothetical protein D4R91_05660 [Sediminibacterium sp.]